MLPPELERLKSFHGHLGPYAAAGYRMGMLACKLLCARGKKLRAEVKTGISPPISCMIDGIQLSSSCTLGKGNITATDEGIPEAIFKGERELIISLKENAHEIAKNMQKEDEEAAALKIWEMTDEELFEGKG